MTDLGPLVPPPQDDEAARACLERVVQSRVFTGSPKLISFLRFVVEETLAGRGDQLKEYAIGVSALGRAQGFDTTSDSAVRVAARQLRFKLSEYFADEGRGDAIVMELPKGGYVPVFTMRSPASDSASAIHATTLTNIADVPATHRARPMRFSVVSAGVAVVAVALVGSALLSYRRAHQNSSDAGPDRIALVKASNTKAALPSIAVLPFLNLSGATNEEFVSDGITEEITTTLARIPGLRVISRTSAFRYKGRAQDVRTIAQELSASTVLEGSLRTSDDKYRITAQLISANDGSHIWSETYDVDKKDLFTVYDVIARAVATGIHAKIGDAFNSVQLRSASHDPVAHALYLEGRFNWNKRTAESMTRSISLYEQAIARDSNYAMAYSGLADVHATMAVNNITRPGVSPPKAIAAATRALAIDPTLGEPYAAIALMHAFQDWNWNGADAEFAKAIELSPSYPTARSWFAITLLARGRFDDALQQLHEAQSLDPLSVPIAYNIAEANYYARRWNAAEEGVKRLLQLDPNFSPAFTLLGKVYAYSGRVEQARTMFLKVADTLSILQSGGVGKRAEMEVAIQKLSPQVVAVSPYWVAVLYATIGENDHAFEWLNRAYDAKQLDLVSVKIDPGLDLIRSDARYNALLHKMKLDSTSTVSVASPTIP